MDSKEDFPMSDGPPIPWAVAESIYEVYCFLYGRYTQSLERIAARGGFSYAEVRVLMDLRQKKLKSKGDPRPPPTR